MKNQRKKALGTLILLTFILAIAAYQVSPVLADTSQCTILGHRVIVGAEDSNFPNLYADDGYFYSVSGVQTGTVPRWLTSATSSFNTLAGYSWPGNQLSYLYSSDNVYWNITSQSGSGNYHPSNYMPLEQTNWKSGSLSNLTSNDGKYVSFESYPTYGQYGLRFNGTYWIDAGNKASLDLKDPFTIELRIKWNAIPPVGYSADIMDKSDGSSGYFLWFEIYTAGRVYLMGQINGNSPYSRVDYDWASPTVGVWYYIAWVRNGANMYLYINGNRVNSVGATTPTSVPDHLYIGGNGYYMSNYFTLDEVAVWNSSKWMGSSFTVPTSAYLGDEPNLCGLWHLDEALGSVAYDSSPNSNDGVASAAPDWVVGYRFVSNPPYDEQYAARFNGTYMLNAGNRRFLNLTGPFTIELRIRLDRNYPSSSWSNDMALVSKHTGGDPGYWMWSELQRYNSTASNMYVQNRLLNYNDPQTISCQFRLKVGVWRHLAWVYDGSNNSLYVDGIRQSGWKSGALPSTGSVGSFLMGWYDTYHLDYCSLDEVAVWNCSKWSGSSFTVPTSPYVGNEANLCGLWHLNEASGTTAQDSSLNHYDGTWSGTPDRVVGYPFVSAQIVGVVFSGTSNTLPWSSLTWTSDLGWSIANVSANIQLFNYTSRRYATLGAGNLTYKSSSTPSVDETKSQTMYLNLNQFRNTTTGAWKMKITGLKSTPSVFQLKCDLVEYSSLVPGMAVEFLSQLPDSNIRSGVSKLNVTVEARCNASALIQNLYLFNYAQSAYQLKNVSTIGMTDKTIFINVTSGMADYISSTGEVKIKVNSTYPGTYFVGVDLVQWGLKYNEPMWEIQYRVDYRTTVSKSDMTQLSVKLKGNLSGMAETAYLSMYNYSSSSWTRIMPNVNHTSIQTQWYNTTAPADFNSLINLNGCLNVTMYCFNTNWATIRSTTDHLMIYIDQVTPDTTPPGFVDDLSAGNPTASSINLAWMAPGDDGSVGTVTGYAVKYSTSGPINNASTWNTATTYSQSWAPKQAGSIESHVVSGLNSGTTYWFAIMAHDEVPNYSGISNSPAASTVDITAPAPITDLVAYNPTLGSITLNWTATGDDGATGRAVGYFVRYSTLGAVNASSWAVATVYGQSWVPLQAGGVESHNVTGLNPGTQYWFAVMAFDETPNSSGVSNSVSETTVALDDGNNGIGGSGFDIAWMIVPAVIVGVGVGGAGLVTVRRRSRLIPKSPFKKRVNAPERVARPKLREYVGESGVVPQPPKRAKFEEKENSAEKDK